MTKISLTRALSELKSLDLAITSKISGAMFVSTSKGQSKKPTNPAFQDEQAIESRIKSDRQSITDLIARRSKIRSAVQNANISTLFMFKGKQMSISEAIDYKKVIDFNILLVTQMRHQLNSVTREINTSRSKVDEDIAASINRILGSESKTKAAIENNADLIKSASTAIENQHLVNIVDPLNLQLEITKLSDEIENTKVELDFTLSEINAKTEIEI